MAETVLITGASQGIGKATTQLFASKGYNVVLAARQADRLQNLAQEIESKGTAVLASLYSTKLKFCWLRNY